ncbi:DUF485 domain-containing protein [Gulosibacter molinativorax]|uniref:DUF485 domain-containing protein n=2 Tax=Gulosibacter molinativorax TaxID=256821 RepID=A0ABT7CA12_9MICO|nr:DUF485 domain-containing protein [Gulosibacter molinativorax]
MRQGGPMHDANNVPPNGTIDYEKFQQTPKFQRLRKKQRSFVFPMTAFFLAWYFAFVLLGAYAPEFMATPVFGMINLGLLLGLGQFITTFAITMWYVRFANSKLDPDSAELREELTAIENGEQLEVVERA